MTKLARSPNRNTFQKERYLERQAEEGRTPENDPDVAAMAEYYDGWNINEVQREEDPEWAKNNLEYDLRSTDWILAKVRASDNYAQNLYAAMCNNDFQRLDTWPILSDQRWSCSWRYAGGIIAHMRESGDYIDWYCSGIRDVDHAEIDRHGRFPVSESVVTDEIRADLQDLGWIVIDDSSKDSQ